MTKPATPAFGSKTKVAAGGVARLGCSDQKCLAPLSCPASWCQRASLMPLQNSTRQPPAACMHSRLFRSLVLCAATVAHRLSFEQSACFLIAFACRPSGSSAPSTRGHCLSGQWSSLVGIQRQAPSFESSETLTNARKLKSLSLRSFCRHGLCIACACSSKFHKVEYLFGRVKAAITSLFQLSHARMKLISPCAGLSQQQPSLFRTSIGTSITRRHRCCCQLVESPKKLRRSSQKYRSVEGFLPFVLPGV